MFITKCRRRAHFLRGLGATMALPPDAMLPALSALAQSPLLRSPSGFVYVPNGVIQDQWVPATVGNLSCRRFSARSQPRDKPSC